MDERDLRDLVALADGSLPTGRRAEVEARVAASPELREELERQRAALTAVRAAAAARAPQGLRAAVAARTVRSGATAPGARLAGRRLRRRPLLAGGVLAAAVAVLLALVLPGGSREGPGVAEAAALGARPPTAPAPGRYDDEAELLDRGMDGVRFPRWEEAFGWRATGARTDRFDGRPAETVFYARGGKTVGYTIVAQPALRAPGNAAKLERRGTEIRSLHRDGRLIVTWRRAGRTCVLSGRDVSRDTMVALASWRAGGRLRY
jgi:anti-sigma factor RsiW